MNKEKTVQFRITLADFGRLTAAAEGTVSQYAREALLMRLKKEERANAKKRT